MRQASDDPTMRLEILEGEWKAGGRAEIRVRADSKEDLQAGLDALAAAGVEHSPIGRLSTRKHSPTHSFRATADVESVRKALGNRDSDYSICNTSSMSKDYDPAKTVIAFCMHTDLREIEYEPSPPCANADAIFKRVKVPGAKLVSVSEGWATFDFGNGYSYCILAEEGDEFGMHSCGSGFGSRDAEFEFPKGTTAKAAAAEINEFIERDMERGVGGAVREAALAA